MADILSDMDVKTKEWTAKNGVKIGGRKYQAAVIGNLLRSAVYIGKIEHKRINISYPGVHDAIIDRKLFDRAQVILEANQKSYEVSVQRSPHMLAGKIFDKQGNRFRSQKTSKSSTRKYRYYALKSQYLPAGDVDEIIVHLFKNLFDRNLSSILDGGQALEFKSVDFDALDFRRQADLIGSMIEKIIYHDSHMTCFIKIDNLSYLRPFKRENYLNTKAEPVDESGEDVKMYAGNDQKHLIVEKEICINSRHLTNRIVGRCRKIITITENDNNLIKALSIGWRYGKMEQNGLSPKNIAKTEQKTGRTVYRYLRLNYLSPNIVNDIMDSQVPPHINLQMLFEIASKHADFEEQEKAFYNGAL